MNNSFLQITGAKANMRHLGQIMGLEGFVNPTDVQRKNLIMYEDGGGFIPSKKAIGLLV